MRNFARRPLTEGEIALGRVVFGDEIDWPSVRIVQAPKLGFGATAPIANTIIFSSWRARADFSVAPLKERSWFVHELAHIWQTRQGRFLPAAKVAALGKRAYRVGTRPGARFAAYNIEAQAEIVRFLFLDRIGQPATEAPPRGWLEAVWASRFERR